MWLAGTPDSAAIEAALQTSIFHEKIQQYIRHNIRAHLDDLTEADIKRMPRNPQLAYSRPPDPRHDGWVEQSHKLE